MKRSKWTSRLACALLVTVTVAGAALAAGTQGSQSDPLVTLSYLNEVVVPDLLRKVDERLKEREKALSEEMEESGGEKATFVTVEVPEGKILTLSAGTQLVFRSGAAKVSSALTDLTDGVSTGTLTANHLYLATADEQTITATTAVTLLVQGGYALS